MVDLRTTPLESRPPLAETGAGAQPPASGASTPAISARVNGAQALHIGSARTPSASEQLNWNQAQPPVVLAQSPGNQPNQPAQPGAINQPSQVHQERLAARAAEANPPTPPDVTTLARIASDVYADPAAASPPPGYRVANEADLTALGLRQADLAPAESSFRARVYVTGTGADTQYVLAFRGSTSDRRDWVSNAQQAAGLQSDHYSRALAIGRALARHEDVPVTITGHSLGGGLASAAAIASGRDATTFNAAGLSQNTINAANAVRSANNVSGVADVSAYYVRGEILSALQDGGDQALGGWLGRIAGSWLGGPVGGAAGGYFGRTFADAPSAYGNRIALEPVRPNDVSWWQDHPVTMHGMNYVLSSLQGR